MDKKLSRRDVLKLMGTASAGVVLAACGVPLETLTPTMSPIAAAKTMTPSPTSTFSPTPTPEAIVYNENDLFPVYSVPFAEKVFGSNGPKVTGSLNTDKSASPINKVDMAPADAAKLMLMVMYESWKMQNKGTTVTLEGYGKMSSVISFL